jgi:hypothetical protein
MTDWIALWMVSGVQHITFRKYPGILQGIRDEAYLCWHAIEKEIQYI